jgi:hypothetical protein
VFGDLLVKLATAVAQGVATDATAPLLRDFAGLQDAQLERLEGIHQDVKVLLEAPAREARLHLTHAVQVSNDELRLHYLSLAQEKLVQAFSYEAKPTAARAAVDAQLAIVFGLLGEEAVATRWAVAAYDDQRAAMVTAAPSVERTLNFPLGFTYESSDFWRYIKRARAAAPDIADEALSRWPESVNECLVYEDEEPPSNLEREVTHALSLGRGGDKLKALAEMNSDANDYYRTACVLGADHLQQYTLVVDLSRNRRAKIQWEPWPESDRPRSDWKQYKRLDWKQYK